MNYAGLHITLKYIGDVLAEPDDMIRSVERVIHGFDSSFDLGGKNWKPATFDQGAKVMVFGNLDVPLLRLRSAVDHFRQDDYQSWQPHLTLDESVWRFIAAGDVTPQMAIERVGSLTLFGDKRDIASF